VGRGTWSIDQRPGADDDMMLGYDDHYFFRTAYLLINCGNSEPMRL